MIFKRLFKGLAKTRTKLSSGFKSLFALNRELHPGEKRLIEKVLTLCPNVPIDFEVDLAAVFGTSGTSDPRLLSHVTDLLDHLDELLEIEGLLSNT